MRNIYKLKKAEGSLPSSVSISTIPISSSGQDFTPHCKKMSGTVTSAKNMVSAKARSSSMDELRATGSEEHWYSADSDTEPDSLTAIPECSNGGQNGKNTTSLGNIINTAVSSSTTSVCLPAGTENGGRIDNGSGIPEAPKAPKFRRGTGLKDKWRESWGSTKGTKSLTDEDNRLLRWFSLRKNDPNFEPPGTRSSTTLPHLTEEELNTDGYWPRRTVQPPRLPELSPEQLARLTPEQLTRRQIVAAIVYSENNYLSSLQRLVNMMCQLRSSHPAILSHTKISSVFHRLPEIFQCHSLFRIALAECVRRWDTDEKIGDVFVASFSKSLVLDVYSEFINNFGHAMDTAKVEARRKSAFADFLKVQLHLHADRLSLFGLMVKPVQRFPQFILLLQDLLKHTPKDHHDRMSLQLALTQLESLAAMLNERKRESEQYQEFVKQIKSIGGKFGLSRSIADDPNRILLRQDIVTQVDFDNGGIAVAKSKSRKLLLLNDMLICVALSQGPPSEQSNQSSNQPSAVDPNSNGVTGVKAEKSVYKWSKHLKEIEVEDISISPTMSRFVQGGVEKRSSLKANGVGNHASALPDEVELLEEMQSLMHDYEVFSRMLVLSSSLKSQYDGFTQASIKETMLEIQHQIRRRDEQISYFDSSFLTLIMGTEKIVFQMQNPTARNEWIEELRLAQLALDSNNSPGWDIPESPYTQHKIPLFVRSLPIKAPNVSIVKSGCYFTHTFVGPTGLYKIYDLLYICTSDGFSSHIKAYRSQQNTLKEISSFDFDLVEEKVNELLFVIGNVWLATESRKIMVFDPANPTKGSVGSCLLTDSVLKLTYFEGCVYAGLADGSLAVFTELHDVSNMKPAHIIKLGDEKVRAVFGSREHVYAACGNAVVSVDTKSHKIEKNVVLNHHGGAIAHMACSGVGLWIVTENSGTVCLYHLESLQHLQDVSIGPSVFRNVRYTTSCTKQESCYVTCLAAHKGWLWIGTNLGVILTIPLPRLEGVPIISTGKANVSFHGYTGPVTFLMPLMKPASANSSAIKAPSRTKVTVIPSTPSCEASPKLPLAKADMDSDVSNSSPSSSNSINIQENDQEPKEVDSSSSSGSTSKTEVKDPEAPKTIPTNCLTRTPSDTGSVGESISPQKSLVVLRKKNSRDSVFSRNCKTLPRGGPLPANLRFSIDSDVYGLYGNLINVRGLEEEGRFVDPLYDALRRSDPELVSLDAKISTLDRRLKMRMSRPRSLDLSNWSVDSKISASSDESVGLRSSPATDPVGIPESTNSGSPDLSEPADQTSTTVNGGTTKKSLTSKPNKKTKAPVDRTVIVVVGGSGYVNNRSDPMTNFTCASESKHNAHLIVWQMKT